MSAAIAGTSTVTKLLQYRNEVSNELEAILSWWSKYMIDELDGGFKGSVNNDNHPDNSADKGIVLNSRILWTFSSAYSFTKEKTYLAIATRAFEYILHHFIDHEHGGVFWSVDAKGNMKNGKKQVYGLAFSIYGMAEYFKVTGEGMALHLAKDLYNNIEQYSFDVSKGGYIEAFRSDWSAIGDLRLSEKDDNEKKTMNTHLHIIEAYANLYRVWPDKKLREKIAALLDLFDRHIINKENRHLNLFMDEDWNVRSSLISFGHDIEAAWLLLECAETAGYRSYIDHYQKTSVELTVAAIEGLAADGGLWYEYDPVIDHWVREKHSWPQAEAMVGFFNAWQLTGDDKYLQYSQGCFDFIKEYIKDHQRGEWFWGIEEDGTVIQKEKAGFWKCPYHNSRACMEIMKRIDAQLKYK
ncbi:MAG: AGE family epimerase/isomerase [Ferruginibacter sp.]|nr:AGE family epimerase/isomerase [Chitinophagaceae bacterium]